MVTEDASFTSEGSEELPGLCHAGGSPAPSPCAPGEDGCWSCWEHTASLGAWWARTLPVLGLAEAFFLLNSEF